jgi:hypothetical protein
VEFEIEKIYGQAPSVGVHLEVLQVEDVNYFYFKILVERELIGPTMV